MKKIVQLKTFIDLIQRKSIVNKIQLEVEAKILKTGNKLIICSIIVPEILLTKLGLKEKIKMDNKKTKKKQLSTRDLLVNFIDDQNKRWNRQEKFNERQEKFNEVLLSLPTIKKEINQK